MNYDDMADDKRINPDYVTRLEQDLAEARATLDKLELLAMEAMIPGVGSGMVSAISVLRVLEGLSPHTEMILNDD